MPKSIGNSRALAPGVLTPANRDIREAASGTPQSDLIVASRNLPDPFFQKSVVLMLPIKENGLLVGLIINKPSKIKVRDLFPDSPELQKLDAMAYFGGPVDAGVGVRSAIFRSKTPPSEATLVFGDVYVSFDPDAIVALEQDPKQAATLRVFVGRAQWAPGQFQNEVAAGAWHSLHGGADSIFTTLPEMLWPRLIEQAEPLPLVRNAPVLEVPAVPLAVSWERRSPDRRFCLCSGGSLSFFDPAALLRADSSKKWRLTRRSASGLCSSGVPGDVCREGLRLFVPAFARPL